MIENNPREKSRALAVFHDDEVKEKTREEILREKTDREIFIVGCKMEKMQEEYENAVRNKRWDKNQECYVNKEGEPFVPRSDIVHDDVLLVIPRSGEYYSNVAKDKTYVKRLDKIIRDAMTSNLRKRNEERIKKNIENLVDDLKKVAEEVKVEEVKTKATKEEDEKVAEKEKAVTKEQQVEEGKKKMKSSVEVKVESSADVVGDAGTGEEKKSEADQKQTKANTEVPITECKKCMEPCSACTEKNEKLRTRDLDFNKIEKVLPKKTECQEECRSSLARQEEEKAAGPCVC
ncbi:golgin subfamily A member 6-like protein 1 [Helianthus annuus]|uniref:golgin subfamily A member 6-like protein 1 n=1 Tax=Helianthus annuus TaxID=4232 RepID=UPI001652F8EE|nr:golgin subfamily A member 6-like protein 1 [Helianthus annuus]